MLGFAVWYGKRFVWYEVTEELDVLIFWVWALCVLVNMYLQSSSPDFTYLLVVEISFCDVKVQFLSMTVSSLLPTMFVR